MNTVMPAAGAFEVPLTPQALYGELFRAVQLSGLFDDGKAFVDAVPLHLAPASICELYTQRRAAAGFSLASFVAEQFRLPTPPPAPELGATKDLRGHIDALWPHLLRDSPPGLDARDSLLGLPEPYVVPGGRFREVYYWDSYFTMLGLLESGRRDIAEGMVKNFAYLIDRYGHIPNGNRSYYLSRSQPPFFYKMVSLLSRASPAAAYAQYLPQLQREYAYWMEGETRIERGQANAHLVCLSDGSLLNRYWDASDTPRDESYHEDVRTARMASCRVASQVFRDLRAAAESGWDFSSRWCADAQRLETIETTAILPVDLNALMHGLEQAIAAGADHGGDRVTSTAFGDRAAARQAAIQRHMWSAPQGYFVDYHWLRHSARMNLSAATLLPLYVGLASPAQATSIAAVLRKHLLGANGLLTTPLHTAQQWDAPNGWAPLQWMAVKGLRRYGEAELAREIAARWVATVRRVFASTGRLMEKYDVVADRAGGGGEYPTQDGFGWTNGVYLALLALYPDLGNCWPQLNIAYAVRNR